MKRDPFSLNIVILIVLISVLTGCTSKRTKVKEYVEAINYEHQLVVNRLDALERSLESYIPDIMERTYNDVLNQLDSSEMVVRGLKPVTEESDLRDDALLLFDTYRLLLTNEYSEMIQRQKKPAGSFTVADEFLVHNLGNFVANHRRKAKEKYEREAANVLEQYKIPFEPVAEESPDSNSSKTKDSEVPVL